jgi:hypothetical protein
MNLTIVPHPIADFDVADVLQIRYIVKKLELPEDVGAQTTIQIGANRRYSTDMPAAIVAAVNQQRAAMKLKPLSELTLPGGRPVWFAGESASGPVRLVAEELADGIHSAFSLGVIVTRVSDAPDEVAAVIGQAGGEVLPIPELVG